MACASLEQPAEAVAVATALLARGANVEACHHMSGNTALAEAQNKQRTELVALLRAQGAT